ncbi:hypothetical protein [Ammoniphilus sp. YIM 78166]|uniref:hypothetical protein n=1 Tax=Ammoniphilus sp. YIM 78166 TaxID=1644106 RepID=UPI00107050F3|nr:hypothetical protein [Ammoniphilus sp. YIM 78166]
MSFLRTVTGIWRTSEETKEDHQDPNLKTPYYTIRFEQMMDTVIETINRDLNGWQVIHKDRERGEIMAEKKLMVGRSDLMITVYPIPPGKSAVDVVASINGVPGDLGLSYRQIVEFKKALKKRVGPERTE